MGLFAKGTSKTVKENADRAAYEAHVKKLDDAAKAEALEKSMMQTIGGTINKGVGKATEVVNQAWQGTKKAAAVNAADPVNVKKVIQDQGSDVVGAKTVVKKQPVIDSKGKPVIDEETGRAVLEDVVTKKKETLDGMLPGKHPIKFEAKTPVMETKKIHETNAAMSNTLKEGNKSIKKSFDSRFESLNLEHGKAGTLDKAEELWLSLNHKRGGRDLRVGKDGELTGTVAQDFKDIINDVRSGEMSMAKGLRKLRATAGQMHHNNLSGFGKNVDPRLSGADSTLAKFNEDVRSLFMKHAEGVGKNMKDPNFMKTVRELDKDYTAHFNIKNNTQLQKATNRASDGGAYINRMLNDEKNSFNKVKEYMDDMTQMGKDMKDPNFVGQQTQVLREAMGARLFSKGDYSIAQFKKYMDNPSGVETLKLLWPEYSDGLTNVAKVFGKAHSLHGAMQQWFSKIAAVGIVGWTGFLSGGPLGGVAAGMTAAGIMRYMGSKEFSKFAVRQFSKNPMEPAKATVWLKRFISKQGDKMGSKVSAEDILASMTGWATVGGTAGTVGYQAYDAYDENRTNEEYKEVMREGRTEAETQDEYDRLMNE